MKNPLERQSSNPALRGLRPAPDATAEQLQQMYDQPAYQATATGRLTLDDVVTKTAMTLGTVIVVAALTWQFMTPSMPILFGAMIGGLVFGLVIAFKHVTAPPAILAYAAIEGVFLGMLSEVLAVYIAQDTAIVGQAIFATLATAGVMLLVYKFEIIRVTPKFTKFLIGAVAGFMVMILLNFVLSLFGAGFGARGFDTFGLIVSIVGAALAALVLLLDFEYIKQSVNAGVDEKESWYCAFGLTVTLIWLYVEMLRIAAILAMDN